MGGAAIMARRIAVDPDHAAPTPGEGGECGAPHGAEAYDCDIEGGHEGVSVITANAEFHCSIYGRFRRRALHLSSKPPCDRPRRRIDAETAPPLTSRSRRLLFHSWGPRS